MKQIFRSTRNWFIDLKCTIHNYIVFRKQLKTFRDYDFSFAIEMFARCIELLRDSIEKKSPEVEPSKSRKIQQMDNLLILLKTDYDGIFEEDPGISFEDNLTRYNSLRDDYYNQIFTIIKGSNQNEGLESWWW